MKNHIGLSLGQGLCLLKHLTLAKNYSTAKPPQILSLSRICGATAKVEDQRLAMDSIIAFIDDMYQSQSL